MDSSCGFLMIRLIADQITAGGPGSATSG
jgi:hypothetical protein